MQYKTVILVDGENLVFRYQEMIDGGEEPLEQILHVPDCFVWNPKMVNELGSNDIVRIAYYTTVVGDDLRMTCAGEFGAVCGEPRPD